LTIFPVGPFGNSLVSHTARGYLYGHLSLHVIAQLPGGYISARLDHHHGVI